MRDGRLNLSLNSLVVQYHRINSLTIINTKNVSLYMFN